jgi:hypothetical protein
MSELRPIGTEFEALGGRFRVIGYRSRPRGDQIEEVECLRPVPFAKHNSARKRKPPKLEIAAPALPAKVLAAASKSQATAVPTPPRRRTTATSRRCAYRHNPPIRRIGTSQPIRPKKNPWPLIILVTAIIAVAILFHIADRRRSAFVLDSVRVTHRR